MTPEIAPLRFKVLVIRDDPPLRGSVVQYVGVVISSAVVGEAPSHGGADEFVRATDWDLAILELADANDLGGLHRLQQLRLNSPILVLTTAATPDNVTAALAADASGCLSRGRAADEWKRVIESISTGGTYLGVRP